MRILHVINDLSIGGAQRLLSDLLPLQGTLLREEGGPGKKSEITLCLVNPTSDSAFIDNIRSNSGINIEILNPEGYPGFSAHFRIIRRLRGLMKKSDICHVHLFPSLYYAAIASCGLRLPLVCTEHSSFNRRRRHPLLRGIEKIVYSRYSCIICISGAVLNNLAQWLGISGSDYRLVTIPNGIPVEKFKEEIGECLSEKMDLSRERTRLFGRDGIPVLMISRFVESKDHPTFLRAIARVGNRDVFAVLVGDGPRREEYERLIKELDIEDRVVMLGSRGDIAGIVAFSEIGVQVSNWEGFGLTVVEMMAGALPVIVSDIDSLSNVVENAGLKVRRGDDAQLADSIMRLAEHPGEREKLGEMGGVRAWLYDMKKIARAYLEVYGRNMVLN